MLRDTEDDGFVILSFTLDYALKIVSLHRHISYFTKILGQQKNHVNFYSSGLFFVRLNGRTSWFIYLAKFNSSSPFLGIWCRNLACIE